MSAHLQFGPEWMRKGPGKSSTTPSNEGTSTAQSAEAVPSTSAATNPAGLAPSSASPPSAGAKAPAQQSATRRNLSNLNVPSAPTPSPGSATSPGNFSFAAAASGASAQASSTNAGQAYTSVPERAPLSSGLNAGEGESSRYSKRLLSLYSTERGPKGVNGSEASTAQGSWPSAPTTASVSATSPQPSNQLKSTRKTYGSGEREAGRRAQSVNIELSGASINGGHVSGAGQRALSGSSNPHDQSDSRRPGLFQRGSGSSAAAIGAASQSSALSPSLAQHRERGERFGAGIQGGVLAGVTPQRRSKGSDSSSSTAATATQQVSSRQDAFATGDGIGKDGREVIRHTRVSHGPDGLPVSSREEWVRLRRERHPGEGPIGPPSDHSGGFSRGFEQQVAYVKQLSDLSSQATRAMSEDRSQLVGESLVQSAAGSSADLVGDDVELQHQAAKLVGSLDLDDEEDIPPGVIEPASTEQDQMPSIASWSPDSAEWLYRDPSGQVQGPFKATMMQEWYTAKYFSNDLLIRRREIEEFATLGKVLQMIGNLTIPFLTPPSQYAVNREYAAGVTPLSNTYRAISSPFLERASGAQNSALAWGSAGGMQQSDVGFDFGSNHSPFLRDPSATGLSSMQSPFDSLGASNLTSDLAGTSDGQRHLAHNDFLTMIQERELAERRAVHEQRQAQLAALALAQSRGDPNALTAAAWNLHAPSGGENFQPHPMAHPEWNARMAHQFQLQVPAHQNVSQAELDQQQPEQRLWQSSHTLAQQGVEQANEGKDEHKVEALRPTESSRENHSQAIPSALAAQAAEADVHQTEAEADTNDEVGHELQEETGGDEIEQSKQAAAVLATSAEDDSPEQLWPQSPTAVEFASEETIKSLQNSAQQSVQFEDMTPVKSRKSKKNKRAGGVETNVLGPPATPTSTVNMPMLKQANGVEPSTSIEHPLVPPTVSTPTSATKVAPWAPSASSGGQDATIGGGLSLREIQEAEARKAAGAYKAGRNRLVQNTNPTSSSPSFESPVSMSWGLAMPSSREAQQQQQQQSSGLSSGPVWNAPSSTSAPKKTLAEIQREEERRRRSVQAAHGSAANPLSSSISSAQAMAAPSIVGGGPLGGKGRGYADSAGRAQGFPSAGQSVVQPTTISSANSGGGWSVVGSSGKTNAAAPSQPSSTMSSSLATSVVPPPAQRSASTQLRNAASSFAPGSSKGPSEEFIRYCKEQLRGLHNIKVDEFIEMLLSFPIDPTPDVVEIIAESVYAASSTLDGRRFAADFVAKRKLDARSGNGTGLASNGQKVVGGGGVQSRSALPPPTGGPRSASEVVQGGPRTPSDAFGGFMVVKARGGKKRG